jgi:hypothetical protein
LETLLMPTRTHRKRTAPWRRKGAGLIIIALVLTAGQGAGLSFAFQWMGQSGAGEWQCRMMLGGSMPDMKHGGHGEHQTTGSEEPHENKDDGRGFCPVCSLSGCSALTLLVLDEFRHVSPEQVADAEFPRFQLEARWAASYVRPPTRAPPILA